MAPMEAPPPCSAAPQTPGQPAGPPPQPQPHPLACILSHFQCSASSSHPPAGL